MRDALVVALHREAEDANGKPTKRLYLVAEKLVLRALEGSETAIKEIFDRVEGKATQPVEHSGNLQMDVHAWLTGAAEAVMALPDLTEAEEE